MKNVDWNVVEEATEFERLVPGGYVAVITDVEDVEEKEYLKIYYDIAEDKFKDYFKQLCESKNFWGGHFIRSYKETALSFFKGFLTAIEASNRGFVANTFDGNISSLRGKRIGLVLSEEEYKSNDGKIKTRLYVSATRAADKIRQGEYKVNDLKKLDESQRSSLTESEIIDDLPFK